jgi:hypothetical protein
MKLYRHDVEELMVLRAKVNELSAEGLTWWGEDQERSDRAYHECWLAREKVNEKLEAMKLVCDTCSVWFAGRLLDAVGMLGKDHYIKCLEVCGVELL